LATGDGGTRAIAGSVFTATMFFKGSSRRSAKNPFFWQRAGYDRKIDGQSVLAAVVTHQLAARPGLSLKKLQSNVLPERLTRRTLCQRNAKQTTRIYRVKVRSSPKL